MVSEYKGKVYNSVEANLEKRVIKLPKLKEVKIRGYRNLKKLEARIINATITKEAGRYYVSVLVEEINTVSETEMKGIIGLDLGISNLITTNESIIYENKNPIKKYEKSLKHEQKNLSRKIRGSKNYLKNKTKIARIHQRVRNTRQYLLNMISKKLINENKIIVIEDLNIKGLIEEKKISKEITDASWGELIRQLEYKAKLKKVRILKIDRYYASSQICHKCGYKNEKIKNIKIRNYECPECKSEHNRDINAAINIMFRGIVIMLKEEGYKIIKVI